MFTGEKKNWEEKHPEKTRLVIIPLFKGKRSTINKYMHSLFFPPRISFLIIKWSHIVKIPLTEKPGGLQYTGLHRIRHN